MRVPRQVQNGEVNFNMTPMIDVVFLLIIFFLVSSHLAKQETQMPLDLPQADSGSEPVVSERPRVTINVTPEGTLLLTGRSVTPDELQSRLAKERTAEGDDLEVRIRSDRSVAYRHVEPIMLSAARAGVWNVTFSVYRTEDVR
jgi:biopolymer transport protein ExbD